MAKTPNPNPDVIDISEYRQTSNVEKGQPDPFCWRDELPDELHGIGQQCIEADERTAQAERSVIEAYYDEGEKLTSFKQSLKDAGVKRQFVALCDSMGIEATRRKRAMRIYDYLMQQGREGCAKYGTLSALLDEITASRKEPNPDESGSQDGTADGTGLVPDDNPENYPIAARLLAGGDDESGGSGGDGDDDPKEDAETNGPTEESEESNANGDDADTHGEDTTTGGSPEPEAENGEDGCEDRTDDDPTLDELEAFLSFARSVLIEDETHAAVLAYLEDFDADMKKADSVLEAAIARLQKVFAEFVIAGHILGLISDSPMTEGDKRRTHERLMEALDAADMDTCWRVFELVVGTVLPDK